MRVRHFEGAEKQIGFVRRQRCLSFDVDDGRLGDEAHPLAWPAVADGRNWCCASCLRIRLRRRSPRAILEAALDHRRRGLLHFWSRGHVDRYWQLWQHGCRRWRRGCFVHRFREVSEADSVGARPAINSPLGINSCKRCPPYWLGVVRSTVEKEEQLVAGLPADIQSPRQIQGGCLRFRSSGAVRPHRLDELAHVTFHSTATIGCRHDAAAGCRRVEQIRGA